MKNTQTNNRKPTIQLTTNEFGILSCGFGVVESHLTPEKQHLLQDVIKPIDDILNKIIIRLDNQRSEAHSARTKAGIRAARQRKTTL